MRFHPTRLFFLFLMIFLLPSSCVSRGDDSVTDLPGPVRAAMAALAASSDAQARERIEFQVDFLRAIKRARIDEAYYMFALAALDPGCTAERPDPGFSGCFEGFDFLHAKILERSFQPTPRNKIGPGCMGFLENCHDMRMRLADGAGHGVELELSAVCRHRGRYWIFGRLACWRRQSDSNR